MIRWIPALRSSAVLVCLLILAGCKDKANSKAGAEAAQATASLPEVRADLARAKKEIADLNEELYAVKDFRDHLQQQVNELAKERDNAILAEQAAQQTIKKLTAQLNRQAESLQSIQEEFNQVKAVIEDQRATITEQEALIEELGKIIEEQAGTEHQQENIEEKAETVEPDEVVEQ